jgi:ribosomal protein S18 acetylase RimI-like enzyme
MIRSAYPRDTDAVQSLVRAAYERWIARFGREPSPMRDDYDYARRIADGQVWILDVDEMITGLIMLTDGPDALMIPNIAVAPAAQGKGHGRRLLAFAEAEAKRRGFPEIRLYVNALMTENIALYQHLGFAEIGRVHGEEPDRNYLCMAKTVS